MRERWPRAILSDIATGSVIATLAAVTGHALGVQQLIRIPDLALYLPAALVGAAIGATRLRPLLWIVSTPLALIALLVAYTPLVMVLSEGLTRRDRYPASVDAVAVLGGGLTPDGLMRNETLDRLLTGIALADSGTVPTMLISRERRNFGALQVSDSIDQARIMGMAHPNFSVVFVDSVRTTRTEALLMRRIALARGIRRIALVTSPVHTRRACATFEAVGFRVTCVPAILRQSGLSPRSNAEDRLRAFRAWLYEMFASATYRSNGWIR